MLNRRATPALGLCVFFLACSKKEQVHQYPFRGTVIRLDPGANVASIANEKVEGWMGPMTMDYPIENQNEYKALHPGEKITATVNVTSEGYSLMNVKPAEPR